MFSLQLDYKGKEWQGLTHNKHGFKKKGKKVRKRDGAKRQSPRLEAQTPFSSPERVLCTKRACGAGNPDGTLEHHLLGCTQHP